jgi:glycyl-tRNA synthetase beta chain
MPEFFLELFSEEIPARMQRDAGIQLEKICASALAPLKINIVEVFTGPRRIAVKAICNGQTEAKQIEERGPRDTAPEAALAGFLGKHKASREDVVAEGGYFLLRRNEAAVSATDLIANALPSGLAKFAWPKSMRWGQSGAFTWVRPLRRIVCLLDGESVSFQLGPVTSGDETEGHRFLSPGAFAVSSAADWQSKLREQYVIADQAERRALIIAGLTEIAAALGLTLADDPGLIDEVTGLVEWPVPLIGKIDNDFMELPPAVRELSMKVNQRYFALRDAAGTPAPYFAFVSNIEAIDGGAAIIAGNERVLRARLSDARHFWDLDLKTPLNELLPKLDKITFHAKIGTQGERVKRIAALASKIAKTLGADDETAKQAEWAGLLSKADLVTGMVGEFPELQGIMGGYYAEKNPRGWNPDIIGPAIRTHYSPKGPDDDVPEGIVSESLALADKIDTLVQFFKIDEKPSGSSDPYALRRAALGIIRIIRENNRRIRLKEFVEGDAELLNFIVDRSRVMLRNKGMRYDVFNAVASARDEDDLLMLLSHTSILSGGLKSPDVIDVLAGYRRGANILRIEESKDGPITADTDDRLFKLSGEIEFSDALKSLSAEIKFQIDIGEYWKAVGMLGQLRPAIDAFFKNVTVNDPDPKIRRNRLALLAQLRDTMHQIADFSKIEG